jgi:hypothetical protein
MEKERFIQGHNVHIYWSNTPLRQEGKAEKRPYVRSQNCVKQ